MGGGLNLGVTSFARRAAEYQKGRDQPRRGNKSNPEANGPKPFAFSLRKHPGVNALSQRGGARH